MRFCVQGDQLHKLRCQIVFQLFVVWELPSPHPHDHFVSTAWDLPSKFQTASCSGCACYPAPSWSWSLFGNISILFTSHGEKFPVTITMAIHCKTGCTPWSPWCFHGSFIESTILWTKKHGKQVVHVLQEWGGPCQQDYQQAWEKMCCNLVWNLD